MLNGGIYKENLYPLPQYAFIVCALFTPGIPKYYQYVDRLAASCEKYRLPYSIYEVPGVHTSINLAGTNNLTFTKANFIARNMERLRIKTFFM